MVLSGLIAIFFAFTLFPQVPIIKLEQLQYRVLKNNNDTLYVVNFWATWCGPCVKELPAFEKANQNFAQQPVKILLISCDSPNEAANVARFSNKKNLNAEIAILAAGDPNRWIPQLDQSWSGSIPATLMYKGGKKVFFYEGDMNYEKLSSTIQKKLK